MSVVRDSAAVPVDLLAELRADLEGRLADALEDPAVLAEFLEQQPLRLSVGKSWLQTILTCKLHPTVLGKRGR